MLLALGYGGGYMDREDVEYIERDDDDEFDEFGRKKKKRRPDREVNWDFTKTLISYYFLAIVTY